MIASGFKPVGWVAGIGTAALGCYMLSLQVAAERAELTSLDHEIVSVRQQIRSLQTELGTRGRLQQLEQWNAEVLALSAPVAGQFLDSTVRLAGFDTRAAVLADHGRVQMASADIAAAAPSPVAPAASIPAPRQAVADARAVAAPPILNQPLVHRASATTTPATSVPASVKRETPSSRPAVAAPVRSASAGPARRPATQPARASSLLDERTLSDLSTAARAERAPAARH